MKNKKVLSFISVLTALTASACSPMSSLADGLQLAKDPGDYKVWTTSATEKICQNVSYDETETSGNVLNVSMCRNELEGAQIIITADEDKDIDEYSVSVSPLISGSNIIPAENISVYNEKYIEILHKFNSNKEFPVNTFVPDAILPFDTAVEYGENKVKAGENQGIYIEVETEAYMAPGLYTGMVTLKLNNKTVQVPMRVKVYDFVISETGTTMNYCSTFGRDPYATFELDSSDDMATAYFEKWLDYRMCCDLPYAGKGGPERYVELLRKYYYAEGFSTYRFYYNCVVGGSQSYKGIPTNGVNAEEMKAHLKAVAKASVEDKVNYLDKAIFNYSNWIDEPNWEGAWANVYNCHAYHNLILSEVEEELRQELIAEDNYAYFVETVSETLLNIPIILPEIDIESKARIDAEWGEESLGKDSFVHCPVIQLLGAEENREYYASDADGYWAYTCVQPVYPYPSNHLDDYLVGWRTLFWMQKAYGFDGYLNWAFCNYITDNTGAHLADPYKDDIRGYYPGDGFMFYPGAPYGIYGPVASLRCVAFRDGMEEYEYLTVLEDTYAKSGIPSDGITQSLYSRLFNGVIPTTSSDVLFDTKTQLCSLIENASGDFGMIVANTAMNGTKATVTFVMSNPATEVYMGETKLEGDNGRYTVTIDLVETNYLDLTVTYKGVTKNLNVRVAGELAIVEIETESSLNMFGVKPESDVSLNTNTAYVLNGNASAKFVLKGKYYGVGNESQTYGYEPFVRINTSVFGDLTKVENVYLNVYNASDKAITVSLTYYTNRNNHIMDVVLTPGWNNITLQNVYATDSIKDAKYFFLRTANLLEADGKTPYSVTLYIDDIVYSKI